MGLISDEKMPVIWRGPMVSGAVMQLLSQTDWGNLDYLIVDTPPGTGDVQLTLLQRIPLTSSVIVTTPQEVSISDCKKGIEMINKLGLPISGLIENMSWFQPDKEGRKYYLFGKDGGKQLAEEYSLDLLGQLPLIELEEDKNLMENELLKIEFSSIADKLLKLELDVGEFGSKVVFAGMKKAYKAESLINKLVICVNNLKHRKMRFGTSEGMILAAGDDDIGIFILSPDDGAKPGMQVR